MGRGTVRGRLQELDADEQSSVLLQHMNPSTAGLLKMRPDFTPLWPTHSEPP